MRALLLAATVALLSTQAQGQQLPPKQFVRPDVTATIRFVDSDDTTLVCAMLGAQRLAPGEIGTIAACTLTGAVPSLIILPSPQSWHGSDAAYRRVVWHELGHWNGWPADHSDPQNPRGN